jgi:hypothetical protein
LQVTPGAYPRRKKLTGSPLGLDPALLKNFMTRLEAVSRDKRSSFFVLAKKTILIIPTCFHLRLLLRPLHLDEDVVAYDGDPVQEFLFSMTNQRNVDGATEERNSFSWSHEQKHGIQ